MTKKEAKAHKLAWNLALYQGRVVKFGDMSLRSFLTVDAARAALAQALEAGIDAKIVNLAAQE